MISPKENTPQADMQDSPMKWLPGHPTLRPSTSKHGPSNQLFSNLLQTMNV